MPPFMTPMENKPSADPNSSISVRWPELVRFIRQLSHDLRNDLNAVELQAAFIDEITTDPELKAEVRRLREMVARMAGNLQKLSARVAEPQLQPIEYRVSEFMEDLRAKIERELADNAAAVRWEAAMSDAVLQLDPQLVHEALIELFANAFRHGRDAGAIVASGKIDNAAFMFTLTEQKSSFDLPTQNWGREPLRAVTTGHYALGLARVRNIIEAHGGELRAEYDDGAAVLRTTVTLPVVAKPSANVMK